MQLQQIDALDAEVAQAELDLLPQVFGASTGAKRPALAVLVPLWSRSRDPWGTGARLS